jgi:hypothetical protein
MTMRMLQAQMRRAQLGRGAIAAASAHAIIFSEMFPLLVHVVSRDRQSLLLSLSAECPCLFEPRVRNDMLVGGTTEDFHAAAPQRAKKTTDTEIICRILLKKAGMFINVLMPALLL